PPRLGLSGPLFSGGMLFAKGMRSPRLVGIRLDGPTLAWNRPVDTSSILSGADPECVYLGGDELTAYGAENQQLTWSAKLPPSAVWSVPLVTQTRIYQFTSRGVYEVDKQNGRLVRLFRGVDLDSLGGAIYVTPKSLITVSNVAVTAYPLNTSTPQTRSN